MRAQRNAVLDRAPTVAMLDAALCLGRSAASRPEAFRLLELELRHYVSLKEAAGKTRTWLARVWIDPPVPAEAMIHWAAGHSDVGDTRRVLHFGALLATFPFFAEVVGMIGRELGLHEEVPQVWVRQQARMRLGDRSTIDVGARKVYTTLRHLGLLEPGPGTVLRRAEQVPVPGWLSGWMLHAVMLGRGAPALDTEALASAPELFTLRLETPARGAYPLLESYTEGGNRRVLADPRLAS